MREGDIPFGAAKWMTFPSALNMLTSSMAWIGWTFSFLSAPWSFLSSTPKFFGLDLTLRLGVPFPLHSPHRQPQSFQSQCSYPFSSSISPIFCFGGRKFEDGVICLPCEILLAGVIQNLEIHLKALPKRSFGADFSIRGSTHQCAATAASS